MSTSLNTKLTTAPAELPRALMEHVMVQVVEYTPNGVALTTTDGHMVLVNAELERMFGYSRAELLEQRFEQLLPERFRTGHALLRDDNWKDHKPRAFGAGR